MPEQLCLPLEPEKPKPPFPREIYISTNTIAQTAIKVLYSPIFIEVLHLQAGKVMQRDRVALDGLTVKAALIDLGWTPPAE